MKEYVRDNRSKKYLDLNLNLRYFPSEELEEYLPNVENLGGHFVGKSVNKSGELTEVDIKYIYKYNDYLYCIDSWDHFNTEIFGVTLVKVKPKKIV